LLIAACIGPMIAADETAEKGRAVFEQYKDTVVTIRTVLSMSMGGNPQERESEANGTVIDAMGLAVLSLSSVDPSGLMARLDRGRDEMVTKITSMKMILADGTELDAEIVLRDADLDLAFVRPLTKPDSAMPFVDLTQPGKPEILDEVVAIAQLGQVARRTHSALVERVEAVVDRPRTFYVLGEHRSRAVVCSPAFTLDGAFVGIGVFRSIQGSDRRTGDNVLIVIVSGDDIREASAQVPPWPETTER